MPIANCIVAPDCPEGFGDLLEIWANESGHSSKHMTVNLIASHQQLGNKYQIMASLILPSLWNDSELSSLQVGLSNALEKYFGVTASQVHVITTIVDSGRVVEGGEVVIW